MEWDSVGFTFVWVVRAKQVIQESCGVLVLGLCSEAQF